MIVDFYHATEGDKDVCFTTVEVEVVVSGEVTSVILKEHFCRKCRHRYTEMEQKEIKDRTLDFIDGID